MRITALIDRVPRRTSFSRVPFGSRSLAFTVLGPFTITVLRVMVFRAALSRTVMRQRLLHGHRLDADARVAQERSKTSGRQLGVRGFRGDVGVGGQGVLEARAAGESGGARNEDGDRTNAHVLGAD